MNHPARPYDTKVAHELDAIHRKEIEAGQLRWWYLSMARPGKFMGAVLVSAFGFLDACKQANLCGLYPGGEVTGSAWPTDKPLPAPSMRMRVLTADEARAL